MHWLDTARSFNPAEKIRRSWLTFLFQLFSDLISFMIPDKLLPVAYPKIDSRRTKKIGLFLSRFSFRGYLKQTRKKSQWSSFLCTVFENHRKVSFQHCSWTVLPDRSILRGQKLVKNCQNWNIQMRLLVDFQTLWSGFWTGGTICIIGNANSSLWRTNSSSIM